MSTETHADFTRFGLSESILRALKDVGYEKPSPIQSQTIELLKEGRDVLGQAQTGTGKTAAFALPILDAIDVRQKKPQAMVLAPTRELAIQVAEAFRTYASHIPGFKVLPIYGGQDYRVQIRALERGVQVVVGTPGRTMDHMRRGTLKLDELETLVLDEADEMLRMGFIDDVEWILEHTPDERQIALFSATMPPRIRRIASKHLNNPAQVTIKVKTVTADTIRQRYCAVNHTHKLDALTRILEAEPVDAMIVFVRTRTLTTELAEKLEARGYAAAALNGDIQQKQRERTIEQLKKGKLDILVATDVAARGLDVERVSHVLNFDIPYDTESYIHRIGRTGRAGRKGDAILFMTPREKHLKNAIERATKTNIEMMALPSNEMINNRRISRFHESIADTLDKANLKACLELVENFQKTNDTPPLLMAAAMAHLLQQNSPFLFPQAESRQSAATKKQSKKSDNRGFVERNAPVEQGMERFRLEVGYNHDVKPGNIVGAIANEAGVESEYIGRIIINDDHSLIDLPEGMPKEIFKDLQKTRVMGQALRISRANSSEEKPTKEKKSRSKAGDKNPKSKRKSPANKTRQSTEEKSEKKSTTRKSSSSKSPANKSPGHKKRASKKPTQAVQKKKKPVNKKNKNKGKPKRFIKKDTAGSES